MSNLINSFRENSLIGMGISGMGLVSPSGIHGLISFAWILGSSILPQPDSVVGIWDDTETWTDTNVWYD